MERLTGRRFDLGIYPSPESFVCWDYRMRKRYKIWRLEWRKWIRREPEEDGGLWVAVV